MHTTRQAFAFVFFTAKGIFVSPTRQISHLNCSLRWTSTNRWIVNTQYCSSVRGDARLTACVTLQIFAPAVHFLSVRNLQRFMNHHLASIYNRIMTDHIFILLDCATRQFRLVTLEASIDGDAPIECSLSTHTIEEHPDYEALSYT